MAETDGILAAIGSTPLVRLRRLIADAPFRLYAKLEFLNPGGSAKDRPALNMVRKAMQSGRITSETVLIESSSGNFGISLAQVCSRLGIRFICVVDPKTAPQNIRIMRAYGAKVEKVDSPDQESGEYLPTRLRRVKELLASIPGSIWLNQYENEHNAGAHYSSTMKEIVQALPRIDYLFCAVSSCGTIRGCLNYIRDHHLSTKVVAVDAPASLISGNAQAGTRHIPGLGAGIRPPLFPHHELDHIVHVSDLESVRGCRNLLEREAIFAGGSSGAVVSAVASFRTQLTVDDVVVVIFPDRGERYLDTVYDDRWVRAYCTDSGRSC